MKRQDNPKTRLIQKSKLGLGLGKVVSSNCVMLPASRFWWGSSRQVSSTFVYFQPPNCQMRQPQIKANALSTLEHPAWQINRIPKQALLRIFWGFFCWSAATPYTDVAPESLFCHALWFADIFVTSLYISQTKIILDEWWTLSKGMHVMQSEPRHNDERGGWPTLK